MAEKFVKVTKDGETIEVSPLVVEDHKRLGWKVVEEAKAEDADEEKTTDADDAKKKKSK
jgi:hypothetical protein